MCWEGIYETFMLHCRLSPDTLRCLIYNSQMFGRILSTLLPASLVLQFMCSTTAKKKKIEQNDCETVAEPKNGNRFHDEFPFYRNICTYWMRNKDVTMMMIASVQSTPSICKFTIYEESRSTERENPSVHRMENFKMCGEMRNRKTAASKSMYWNGTNTFSIERYDLIMCLIVIHLSLLLLYISYDSFDS